MQTGEPQQSTAMSMPNVGPGSGVQAAQGMGSSHVSMGSAGTSATTSGMSNMSVGSGSAGTTGMGSSTVGASSGTSAGQQMPSAADISLMLSLGLGLNPSDAQQLANWDLQKLAMYLVSNF